MQRYAIKMPSVLNPSTLPEFKPKKHVVHASNRSMTSIEWAFSSCWPISERGIYMTDPAPTDECLRLNATAAMQWSYSLMHLAHHYEKGLRKFILTTEDRNTSILLEVTSLKACPEDVDGLWAQCNVTSGLCGSPD